MMPRRLQKRRHSSEGSILHITGTGTTSEEAAIHERRAPRFLKPREDDDECGGGEYGDFHTIDWQRDLSRDRYRHRYIRKKMGQGSWQDTGRGYCEKLSGWMCIVLVGVAAGVVAAVVDIGGSWMSDLKLGVCPGAFWLNREQCCWSANDTLHEGDGCGQWFSWYRLVFRSSGAGAEEYLLAYFFYVLWSMLFATLAACMVKTLAPYACGSGLPEIKTILGGFIMRGYLGKWTLVVKSLGIMLAVSAGLSLGKEGPMVHVVCCLGNVASYLFPKYGKNEAKKREILSAAAAAGVSVAFGAPIGGVLFSLEEVSYYFPMRTLWRSFVCALAAAFVLRSVDPMDHSVKFSAGETRKWTIVELPLFVLLGALGGVIGAAFIRCNIAWCRRRKTTKLGRFPILEVSCVCVVTALVSFPNPFTRMDAGDLIRMLLSSPSSYCGVTGGEEVPLLLCALACKFLLTIFTFGIKVPCGLFVPSLATGAILGRLVGIGVQGLALHCRGSWPFRGACAANNHCVAPGLYAMIGAAACLAGVTRMTVSLVVIMFELTGRVDSIVPVMAAVVASKWVGDAIDKEGIYDAHIRLNDYPYLDNKKTFKYSTRAIDLIRGKVSKTGVYCLSERGMTLAEIEGLLHQTSHAGFPVVLSLHRPCLAGFVLRRDLTLTLEHMKMTHPSMTSRTATVEFASRRSAKENSINLKRIVDQAPLTVTVQTPVEMVIEMFCKLGLRQILVTDHGKILGIITKKDILKHIQQLRNNKKEQENK